MQSFLELELEITAGELTEDQLLGILSKKIELLLKHDMQKFIQILYRIDIDEHKASEAMKKGSLTEISAALSAVIIERQKRKLRFKKRE